MDENRNIVHMVDTNTDIMRASFNWVELRGELSLRIN